MRNLSDVQERTDEAGESRLRFETYGSFEQVLPLKAQWEKLADTGADFYSARSFAVCKASWEQVAQPRGRSFFCVAAFRGEQMVLVWPFVIYSRKPFLRVAQTLGPEATEYATVLHAPGEDGVKLIGEALTHVRTRTSCNVVRLELVRPESALAKLVERSDLLRASEPMYVSATRWDGIADWETYASRWNAKQRRRRRRKLEERGAVSFEAVTGSAAAGAANWVLEHKARWMDAQGEQNVWVRTAEFRALLMELAQSGRAGEGLVVFVLKLDGKVVAGDICLMDRHRVEGWVTTYDSAFADLGVGRILMEHSAQWAFDRRLEFDHRLSWAEYKEHWTNWNGFVHSHWLTDRPWIAGFFRSRMWAKRRRDAFLQNRREAADKARSALKARLGTVKAE